MNVLVWRRVEATRLSINPGYRLSFNGVPIGFISKREDGFHGSHTNEAYTTLRGAKAGMMCHLTSRYTLRGRDGWIYPGSRP